MTLESDDASSHSILFVFFLLSFGLTSRRAVASEIEKWKEFRATMHRRTPKAEILASRSFRPRNQWLNA